MPMILAQNLRSVKCIIAISLSGSSLFKDLRGPLGPFFIRPPSPLWAPPPRRRQINHAYLVKPCRDRRRLLAERSTMAWIPENRKKNRARPWREVQRDETARCRRSRRPVRRPRQYRL